MRKYIFSFDQDKAVKLGLSVSELLILDYLRDFIKSGSMNHKDVSGVRFFLVVYKKLLKDLPILDIKERQLRNIFKTLESKKVVKLLSVGANYLYIHIEYCLLCEKLFSEPGKKLPDSIDKINNKIKILHNNTKLPCRQSDFLQAFKTELRNWMTDISYTLFFATGLSISEVDSTGITFTVKNIDVAKRMETHLTRALAATFDKLEEKQHA